MLVNIDYFHLKCFSLVAKNLNFTETAKELYVSQSAVSQNIAELEKRLGVNLFTRTKRKVKLTQAGILFWGQANQIIEKWDRATQKVLHADGKLSLRIGSLNSSQNLLFNLTKHFYRKYPDVQLFLERYNSISLYQALKSKEVDIAFTVSSGIQEIDLFNFITIGIEKLYVALNNEHSLRRNKRIKINDLSNENFILLNRNQTSLFDRILFLCSREGFFPKIVCEPTDIDSTLLLVQAGVGISIVPEYVVSNHFENPHLCFIALENKDIRFDRVCCWRKNNFNPAIPMFVNELQCLHLDNEKIS